MTGPSEQNREPEKPASPATRKPRRIGFMEGEIKVPDDFDTMNAAEIEQLFYGEETRADR